MRFKDVLQFDPTLPTYFEFKGLLEASEAQETTNGDIDQLHIVTHFKNNGFQSGSQPRKSIQGI